MKKIVFVLLSLVFCLIAVSCGNSVKASEKAVSIATSAVAVADDYLDNNISGTDANSRIETLYEQMDYVDKERDSKTHAYDLSVQIDLLSLEMAVSSDVYESSSETYAKVIESRNKLASDVGLKAR